MSFYQPTSPSLQPFNVDAGYGSSRPWDAPGARSGQITVGSYYTLPGSTSTEYARAFYVGTGSGNITYELIPEVSNGVVQTVTIPVYPGQWYPLLTQRITAVTGTVDNLIWAS